MGDVTGMPEITQVHVQKIRQNNNKELYEMAKYSGKDSDYLVNQRVFDAFYKSLKGKQVLVYSGLFKEARKKLKNGELDYLKKSIQQNSKVEYHSFKNNSDTL